MLIVAQLIAPFTGAPEFTPSDTLFPMYFDSPIDDRRLIGIWGGLALGMENGRNTGVFLGGGGRGAATG